MEWVEVRAENIEAAEELALDQLGVAREDAEFEVVTREENRLFGLKKTEARVRARVKPADLPSKTTNNRKRSKNNSKTQKSNKTAPKMASPPLFGLFQGSKRFGPKQGAAPQPPPTRCSPAVRALGQTRGGGRRSPLAVY